MTTHKITVSRAMQDLREEFLSRIFKNYPDHKKMWKAEDVQNELHGAMYSVTLVYLNEEDRS